MHFDPYNQEDIDIDRVMSFTDDKHWLLYHILQRSRTSTENTDIPQGHAIMNRWGNQVISSMTQDEYNRKYNDGFYGTAWKRQRKGVFKSVISWLIRIIS